MQPDSKEFLVAFGRRLKDLRRVKGWSLRDMVEIHGYSDSHWRNYESGRSGLTIDSVLRIAALFELSIVKLFNGLGEYPHLSISDIERKAAGKTSGRSARKTAAKKTVGKKSVKMARRVVSGRASAGSMASA